MNLLDTPSPFSGSGWSRRRIAFLALSALAVLGILAWASEVLLPFILAIIIAYVLTPLVEACERLKIPRSVSILIVYVVTLSTLYMAIAAMAPRISAMSPRICAWPSSRRLRSMGRASCSVRAILLSSTCIASRRSRPMQSVIIARGRITLDAQEVTASAQLAVTWNSAGAIDSRPSALMTLSAKVSAHDADFAIRTRGRAPARSLFFPGQST